MEKRVKYTEAVISAFLECQKDTEIAKRLSLSTKTIQRYRHDPKLKKMILERRSQYVETAVSRMNQAMITATDALIAIIEDKDTPPSLRLKAIQTMFDACNALECTRSVLKNKADICVREENSKAFDLLF